MQSARNTAFPHIIPVALCTINNENKDSYCKQSIPICYIRSQSNIFGSPRSVCMVDNVESYPKSTGVTFQNLVALLYYIGLPS